jgi:hypothetical protein
VTDVQQRGLRQPLLGAGALLITVGFSLAFCALFAPATLETWISLFFTNAVPTMVLLDLGLHLEYPAVLTRVSRPARAVLFVALGALASAVVSPLALLIIGGGVTPPNPFVILFAVQTVPVTLVLVILFRSWPFTALTKVKGVIGIGTLVLAYVVTWVLYRVFFDFAFLKGAPIYLARLDPRGLFTAWQSAAFIIATAAVLLLFVLFDFWPLTILIHRRPALGREPLFGLLAGGLVLLVTLAVWGIPVGLAGMDPVVFLVRVPVALIFGVFIVMTLFQGAGLGGLKQPGKGAAMTAAVIVAAAAVQVLYGAVARLADPGIAAGPPSYEFELWLATAMLGVTFPVIVVFCGALGFWPLVFESRAGTSARASQSAQQHQDTRDQRPDERT